MATPHISANESDVAEAVLLPGDPLRAQYIAETFFDDARQVTAVRNMLGYTGTYQGAPVTAMGTGMGIPSASIYITELIRFYGARRLIRVGSCGAISTDVAIRDVILAIGACTDSAVNRSRYGGWDYAATADFGLLGAAAQVAMTGDRQVHVGNVHSSDSFYNPNENALSVWQSMNVLAVEMEAAGLYAIAAGEGARALAILTVSDHIVTQEETTSDERERTFGDMVTLALDTLVKDAP
ncbi:MAG: purine-nucleoside phosphorylase [Acidimicrobiia bacterium]|nr:MAG: purine-nucleoside phosphorylase [Acidimicrobiia bacterium]